MLTVAASARVIRAPDGHRLGNEITRLPGTKPRRRRSAAAPNRFRTSRIAPLRVGPTRPARPGGLRPRCGGARCVVLLQPDQVQRPALDPITASNRDNSNRVPLAPSIPCGGDPHANRACRRSVLQLMLLIAHSFRGVPAIGSSAWRATGCRSRPARLLRLTVDSPGGVVQLQGDAGAERIHRLRAGRPAAAVD